MTAGHGHLRRVVTLYHLLKRLAFYFDSLWRAWLMSAPLDDVGLHYARVRLQCGCHARNGLPQPQQKRTLGGLLHCFAPGRRRGFRRRLIKSRIIVRTVTTTTSSSRVGIIARHDDFVQDLGFLIFSGARLFRRGDGRSSRGNAFSVGFGGNHFSCAVFDPRLFPVACYIMDRRNALGFSKHRNLF